LGTSSRREARKPTAKHPIKLFVEKSKHLFGPFDKREYDIPNAARFVTKQKLKIKVACKIPPGVYSGKRITVTYTITSNQAVKAGLGTGFEQPATLDPLEWPEPAGW
jgi:hypothetical protein